MPTGEQRTHTAVFILCCCGSYGRLVSLARSLSTALFLSPGNCSLGLLCQRPGEIPVSARKGLLSGNSVQTHFLENEFLVLRHFSFAAGATSQESFTPACLRSRITLLFRMMPPARTPPLMVSGRKGHEATKDFF